MHFVRHKEHVRCFVCRVDRYFISTALNDAANVRVRVLMIFIIDLWQGRGAVDIVTDSLKIDMTISNQSDCRGKTEDTCDGSDVQKKTSDMTQKVWGHALSCPGG